MAKENSTTTRRSEQILQELLRDGEVAVDKLAEQLKVSEATIRRDLTELERQGLLLRSHGGAVPVAPMLYEPFRHLSSFQEQEEECAAEKRRIGLLAASLIADGEIIAIGAGTTTTQVARSIRHRKGIHGLTTYYPDQAAIHRAMMRQARQRIVVADHRKIGVVGSSLIWPAADFHTLVTDKTTSDKSIKPFAAKNINVLRA